MLTRRRTAAALAVAALAMTAPLTTEAVAHERTEDRWERRHNHHHGRWVYRTEARQRQHRRWHDWQSAREGRTLHRHLSTGKLRVESTAYCLEGRMANGQPTYEGAAAMNGVPLGTKFRIKTGPLQGEVVVVKDRIGSGSEFDVAMPDDCSGAYRYGRRVVNIKRIT